MISVMDHLWKALFCIMWGHLCIAEAQLCDSPQYVELAERGTINCSFNESSFGIYWYESEDLNRKPFFYLQENVKSGEGYNSKEFDIHANGSLIIKNVSLDHDHIFTVVQLQTKESNSVEMNIQVVVTALPDISYPLIGYCDGNSYCYRNLPEVTTPVICFSNGTRPQMDLSWKLRTVKGDREIPFVKEISEEHGLITTFITTNQYAIQSDTFLLLVCQLDERLPLWTRTDVVILLEVNQPEIKLSSSILVKQSNESTILPCSYEINTYFVWKRQNIDLHFTVLAHGSSGNNVVESSNYTLMNESSLVIPGGLLETLGIYICFYGNEHSGGMIVYNVSLSSSEMSSSPSPGSFEKSNTSTSLPIIIGSILLILFLAVCGTLMIVRRKRNSETELTNQDQQGGVQEMQALISEVPTPEFLSLEPTTIKVLLNSKGQRNIYNLRYSSEKIVDQNSKIRKCEIGKKTTEDRNEKVIIFLGEVGAGKTTMVNHLINYLFRVKWEDSKRFEVVLDDEERKTSEDPSKNQTKWMSAYTFLEHTTESLPFDITFIDTPGFSGNLSEDKVIIKQIQRFFESTGINHVDVIAFVRKVSDHRLTRNQQYIIDSVDELFGKDVIDNMYLFGTYASSSRNDTFEKAVEKAGLSFAGHFYFNNESLSFPLGSNEDALKMYWDLCQSEFDKVSAVLEGDTSISLDLSKRVSEERQRLEAVLDRLPDILQTTLIKYNNLKDQESALKKQTEYVKIYEETQEVNLDSGEMALVCTKCKNTCHYPCTASYTIECSVYAFFGGCRVCEGHCNTSPHYIRNYIYKSEIKEEKVSKYFQEFEGDIQRNEALLEIELEKKIQEKKINDQLENIRQCINSLNENALKSGDITVKGYLEKIKESELEDKKPGWEERVGELTKLVSQVND